jgi:hypothetical protein
MEENKPRENKVPAGISISREARDLADALKRKKGVSRTAVFEMAIREMATREGVELTVATT